MEKYKTIAENNVTINACSKGNSCFCDGSCKIKSKSIVDKLKPIQLLNNLQIETTPELEELIFLISSNPNDPISNMERYTPLSDGQMLEDIDGEYVKFFDVINLFARKD